jgi:hypothetical protein
MRRSGRELRQQPACPFRKIIRKNPLNEFSFRGGALSNPATVKKGKQI